MRKIVFTLALAPLWGCGAPSEESNLLATVGEKQITTAEFAEFAANIPDGMKTGASQLEINRTLLGSLIDKTLLLAESRALDLESDPVFKAQEAKEVKTKIFSLYQ